MWCAIRSCSASLKLTNVCHRAMVRTVDPARERTLTGVSEPAISDNAAIDLLEYRAHAGSGTASRCVHPVCDRQERSAAPSGVAPLGGVCSAYQTGHEIP